MSDGQTTTMPARVNLLDLYIDDGRPKRIKLSLIDPMPGNRVSGLGNLSGLKTSMKGEGQKDTVLLMKKGERYVSIRGHRRVDSALEQSSRSTIDARVIREVPYLMQLQISNDTGQSKPLTEADVARRSALMMLELENGDANKFSAEFLELVDSRAKRLLWIGQQFGITPSVVEKRLKLAGINQEVFSRVASGMISPSLGLVVAQIPSERQLEFADRLQVAGVTTREKARAEKAKFLGESVQAIPSKTAFSRASTGVKRLDQVLGALTDADWSKVASEIHGLETPGHGADGLDLNLANTDALIEGLVTFRNSMAQGTHAAKGDDGECELLSVEKAAREPALV